MFFSSLLLAFTSSIDSFGIGVTYGIKKTKISLTSKIVLFAISFIITNLSIFVGDLIRKIFPEYISYLLGNSILIIIGFFIIATSNSANNNSNYDFNHSNLIDPKEAFVLGIVLSMDSFCIGLCTTTSGINNNIFPFFVSIFQFIFLTIGNYIGNKINSFFSFSNKISSIISGFLLILIGILRFM